VGEVKEIMSEANALFVCSETKCTSYPSFWTEDTLPSQCWVDEEGIIADETTLLVCPVCGVKLREWRWLQECEKKVIRTDVEAVFYKSINESA